MATKKIFDVNIFRKIKRGKLFVRQVLYQILYDMSYLTTPVSPPCSRRGLRGGRIVITVISSRIGY
jgi:hypothetical protein